MELVYGNYLSIMDVGTNREVVDAAFKEQERGRLTYIINQWNAKRLDLFEVTQPDQDLKYHGVMRFFWEDQVSENVATKCVRVSCEDTAQSVTETLLEKFRPDMKLKTDSYALHEVHVNKDERRLGQNEKPLLVQLSWIQHNCEGRFVLKNIKTTPQTPEEEKKEKSGIIQNFKRTLSKKEKKDKKKDLSGSKDNKEKKENGQNTKKSTQQSSAKSDAERKKSGGGLQDKASRRGAPAGSQQGGQGQAAQNKENGDNYQGTSTRMLPVSIRLPNDNEEAFLVAIVSYTNSSTVHFPLSPAYAFYLLGRSLLVRPYDCTDHIATITNKMVAMIHTVIEKHRTIAVSLAFWMANAAELLNFLRQDRELNPLTRPAQSSLAQLIHHAFRYLSQRLRKDLERHMPSFLTDTKDQSAKSPAIEGVLSCLVRAMSLLRRCRVNAAFSIQLFSQLLHFISAWLLNWLLGGSGSGSGLGTVAPGSASASAGLRARLPRSPLWLETLRQRLTLVSAWAERQGLELAADCHLSMAMQAITLLSMSPHTMQDTRRIHEACFKLNSLQIRTLMANQPTIPTHLIDNLVALAESTTDDLLQREGWEVQLVVEVDLRLPFLLPEDGYACDNIQGIPHGFRDFLEPICHKGFCSLVFHPFSAGSWTIFFSRSSDTSSPDPPSLCYKTNGSGLMKPDVAMIVLKKPLHRGLGLSIVAAKGPGQNKLGIFIRSIVKGGTAHIDGRLSTGDQLLSMNGQSLVGLTQEKAADILLHSSSVVSLEVVKSAAVFYGLEDVLSQPPPVITTEAPERSSPCKKLVGMRGTQNATVLQRNRWEYRSNPNLAYHHSAAHEMSVDPVTPANKITSVSTGNLLEEQMVPSSSPPPSVPGCQREYLTLPTPRSHSSKEPEPTTLSKGHSERPAAINTMRHARSQENLCEERRLPSIPDRPPQAWKSQCDLAKQDASSSAQSIAIPVQPSSNIRAVNKGPPRASMTGVLMKTSQPTRIDVPASPSHGLSFVTFRPPPGDQGHVVSSQTLIRTPPHHHHSGPQPPAASHRQQHPGLAQSPPAHAWPTLPRPHLAPALSAQHKRLSARPQAPGHNVPVLSPSKEAPGQTPSSSSSSSSSATQGLISPSGRQTTGLSVEAAPGGGLRLDPWRREEQERLQKQYRHQAVGELEQEVLQLQGKVQRTLEESERLRRLSLEWQFQRRLQEFQQQQSESEEEGDVDIREHERRQQEERKSMEANTMEQHVVIQQATEAQTEDSKATAEVKGGGDVVSPNHKTVNGSHEGEILSQVKAPEKLSFKERQKLFALAVSS